MEFREGPTHKELTELFVLNSLRGFGPQKFKQVFLSDISTSEILAKPSFFTTFGKRGVPIREQLEAEGPKLHSEAAKRAEKQLDVASRIHATILTYRDSRYPKTVFESNNPIPILYARGNLDVLRSPLSVACVGSRKIRPPYSEWHASFAKIACTLNFTITSGFALGADTIGHKAAVTTGGRTICVMPCGLDRPFPPENKMLFQDWLINDHAVFISEFSFGTGAASLNLRKRNKLIIAAARGVLVSQSSAKGGAMNAYRFAIEQKKPIATFSPDSLEDTSGNLLISTEKNRCPVKVFAGPQLEEVERWLHGLSSSI